MLAAGEPFTYRWAVRQRAGTPDTVEPLRQSRHLHCHHGTTGGHLLFPDRDFMFRLTFCDNGDNHWRAERTATRFLNPLLILACRHGAFFQDRTETFASFTFYNKEVPRLQGAMIRCAHTGAQNVFQLL